MENRTVYLDHNATTPMAPEVFDAMVPYLKEYFYNPSSLYYPAQKVREEIEVARNKITQMLNAVQGRLIFTSGGTEADNFALKGVMLANQKKGKHLITSKIEHHGIITTSENLEKMGYEVTYLPVGTDGIVNLNELKKTIRKDTVLISIMHANNETGVIQPVEEIAKIAHENNVIFHTDAVQTVGKLPIDIESLDADLVSFSGHKFYGPKGIGALYIKNGVRFVPLIDGGAQERHMRAGTEYVAGIIGMAKALELAIERMDKETKKESALRDKLEKGILAKIPDCQINGNIEKRLPNTTNISIQYVEGEALLMYLSEEGICVSSGSACSSSSLEPSHVLLAMGISHEIAHGSVRFSFGRMNTEEDVNTVLEKLPKIVERLRQFSPFGKNKEGFWDKGVPRDNHEH